MKEYYTVTELAEKTGIADTTIRRYISKFPDFFVYTGGSRSKRYEETAIKVLIRIKGLFDKGYETEQVDSTLRNEFPMVVDSDKEEKDKEKNKPTLATYEDIEGIKQALKEQQEHAKRQEEFNKALLDKLEQQERYIRDSLEKRDQLLLETLNAKKETAASKEKESKKGFFSRLLGK